MKIWHAILLAFFTLAIGLILGQAWVKRGINAEHMQGLDAMNSLLTDAEIRVYAEHGRLGDIHKLADTDIEWLLYNVKPGNDGPGKESDDAKIKTLYFVAKTWEKHPPDFGVSDFEKQRTSNPAFIDHLISNAKEMQARDMAILQWAEAQCVRRPDLDCRPMKADTEEKSMALAGSN